MAPRPGGVSGRSRLRLTDPPPLFCSFLLVSLPFFLFRQGCWEKMLSKSTTGFIAGGGITYADILLFNMLDWLSLASNVGLWPTPGYPLLQAHYAQASSRSCAARLQGGIGARPPACGGGSTRRPKKIRVSPCRSQPSRPWRSTLPRGRPQPGRIRKVITVMVLDLCLPGDEL